MNKKNKTDFYLLRKKSLSEGDLFVTDYIKSKDEIRKLKLIIEILSKRVDRVENKIFEKENKITKLIKGKNEKKKT
tara:strand:+ start:208 stop:435 length:228 start_codon:yes stop_codon:yes gene_type:complete